MANSSSEDETDTLPKRPTRIQPYQFEPARQDFERVPVFHGVCQIALTEVLATQMGVMRRSKKVRSPYNVSLHSAVYVTHSGLQRQPSLSSICDPLSFTTSAFTQQYM